RRAAGRRSLAPLRSGIRSRHFRGEPRPHPRGHVVRHRRRTELPGHPPPDLGEVFFVDMT
ncbi:hypothetical protein, partial [Pseudonocardia sp. SID8383]|uniref:hypothetical protein n=1 Tax=Pseudonocardia sp. SID8383 TaxID=2690363 RepID=UPI001F2DDE03